MIAQGATSFWEGYDANEDEVKQYGFYGRPFGKSLCHAWSSGPAALIPSELLGIRPLSDGWATFEIDPQVPASMQPLEATIPTPYGDIRVWLRDNQLKVEVPQGKHRKIPRQKLHLGSAAGGPAVTGKTNSTQQGNIRNRTFPAGLCRQTDTIDGRGTVREESSRQRNNFLRKVQKAANYCYFAVVSNLQLPNG